MFVEALGGVVVDKAASAVFENRNYIATWGKDFYNRIAKGQNLVVFFGAGGTGKTTTGQVISGELDLSEFKGEYDLSTEVEKKGIKDRYFINVQIPPGQKIYRDAIWSNLIREIIKSKRVPIIVNVVCWGMHSPAHTELSSIPEFSDGVNEQTVNKFMERNRRDELEALKDIAKHSSLFKTPIKMLTLVTKQDLWWNEREAVKEFYEEPTGEYQAIIAEMRKSIGSNNFTYETWSVSYGHINQTTADGHKIFATAAGYDDVTQITHLKRLEQKMDALCK